MRWPRILGGSGKKKKEPEEPPKATEIKYSLADPRKPGSVYEITDADGEPQQMDSGGLEKELEIAGFTQDPGGWSRRHQYQGCDFDITINILAPKDGFTHEAAVVAATLEDDMDGPRHQANKYLTEVLRKAFGRVERRLEDGVTPRTLTDAERRELQRDRRY